MIVKVRKLDERAKMPTKGSEEAAGFDLYALEDAVIKGNETVFIHTGIALQIQHGYFGAIYARSGLACKHNIRPANCVGIIDSDYRGEILVAAFNDKPNVTIYQQPIRDNVFKENVCSNPNSEFTIHAGDRIAQLVIHKVEDVRFFEVTELEQSDRGEGGFGSTGSN